MKRTRTSHPAQVARKPEPESLQEKALSEKLIANSQSGIYIIQDGKLCFVNPQVVEWLGFSEPELISMNALQLVHPDDRKSVVESAERMLKGQRSTPYEYRTVTKSGNIRWVLESVSSITYKGKQAVLGNCLHITEQKLAEEKVVHLNRVYAVLSGINQIIIRVRDRDELFREACRVTVEKGAFRMAWIGLVDPDTLLVKPAARWGFEEGYLQNSRATVADVPTGRGPTGTAIRTGRHFISNDNEHDPAMEPWRVEAMKRGYRSSAAFPLRVGNQVVGAFNIHAAEPHFFNDQEILLLDELAGDISYGLESIRREQLRHQAEAGLQNSLVRLRASFESTIHAMALTIEMRDPYTAGHQHKVAQLAHAIARDMGFSEDAAEGLRMAGMIHDLGKIAVPAEILSKPGRLSHMEYSLVRAHPQIGYDILKEIDFPWPVARIVHQHHERMDGSGYPSGLSGETILPEARILAVADVVEAMSSHRPYRPALGKNRAVEEIAGNRGRLYDASVVDVCLRVLPCLDLEPDPRGPLANPRPIS